MCLSSPSQRPVLQQLRADLVDRRRKNRLQKLVRSLADGLLRRPPVQLLSATIPVGDDVVHIADENRVVGEIQQAGLLGSLLHFDLEPVAGLTKFFLDAPSNGAEPRDQECEGRRKR